MLGVLLALFVGFAAGLCSTYVPLNSTCVSPESSECVSECSRRRFEFNCVDLAECKWNTTACLPVDTNKEAECQSQDTSTDCGNVTHCVWKTYQCVSNQSCSAPSNAPASLNCTMDPATGDCPIGCTEHTSCKSLDRCGIIGTESSCTASSGCFWADRTVMVSSATSNVTISSPECMSCFPQPGAGNLFLRIHDLEGRVCTAPGRIYTFTRATSSATGCDAIPMFPLFGVVGTDGVCAGYSDNDNTPTSSGGKGLSVFAGAVVLTALFSF